MSVTVHDIRAYKSKHGSKPKPQSAPVDPAAVDARVQQLVADEKATKRAAADEKRKQLRAVAARDVQREQARAQHAEEQRLMALADAETNERAPVLRLEYRGIEVLCRAEVAPNQQTKEIAYQSFRDCHGLSLSDSERNRYIRRREAVGKSADTTMRPVEYLVAQFRDVARSGLKHGVITITDPMEKPS